VSAGSTGTSAQIGTTAMGVTTYVDSAVVAAITYCYRVMAFNTATRTTRTRPRLPRRRLHRDRRHSRLRLRRQQPSRHHMPRHLRPELSHGDGLHPDGYPGNRLALRGLERRGLRRHRSVCPDRQHASDRDRHLPVTARPRSSLPTRQGAARTTRLSRICWAGSSRALTEPR
jgi:hypothetical protein